MEARLSIGPSFGPLMDMGNLYAWVVFGALAGIYSFIVAVLLEAWLSKKFFSLRTRHRLLYSFIANLTSAACGVIFAIYGLSPLDDPFKWIMISLLLTIPIEYLWWIIFLKAKGRALLKVLGFCIAANVASYVVSLLIPFIIGFVIAFIKA